MTRSLADAGLTARPRFIRAADLADRDITFDVLNATVNLHGYNNQAEVVFTIRCRDIGPDQAIYDAEGTELTALSELSMTLNLTESRQRIALYFKNDPNAESLGPLCFERIAATRPGMSPFLNLVDYVPLVANGRPIQRNGPRPAPVGSGARGRDAEPPADWPDDTDALPF